MIWHRLLLALGLRKPRHPGPIPPSPSGILATTLTPSAEARKYWPDHIPPKPRRPVASFRPPSAWRPAPRRPLA